MPRRCPPCCGQGKREEVTMKIAILGDIHGNIEALKVAHKAALEAGVNKIGCSCTRVGHFISL